MQGHFLNIIYTLVGDRIMWICTNCNEQLEGNFGSCWQCGTYQDGKPPAEGFRREKEQKIETLDSEFIARFKCIKCSHVEARVKRVATTGTGLSKLTDIQHNSFIAVSCENCGYTEFFNPEVLEGKKYFGTIMDVLFGS